MIARSLSPLPSVNVKWRCVSCNCMQYISLNFLSPERLTLMKMIIPSLSLLRSVNETWWCVRCDYMQYISLNVLSPARLILMNKIVRILSLLRSVNERPYVRYNFMQYTLSIFYLPEG